MSLHTWPLVEEEVAVKHGTCTPRQRTNRRQSLTGAVAKDQEQASASQVCVSSPKHQNRVVSVPLSHAEEIKRL